MTWKTKTERTWGKERVGTNFENILCRSEKERIRSMYNKTIIRFGFCDIQNNQGLGKGYQPQPITPTSTLIILDITKTSSNNCLELNDSLWLYSVDIIYDMWVNE